HGEEIHETEEEQGERTVLPTKAFPMPNENALRYVEEYVEREGKEEHFDVLDVPLHINARRVDETIRSVLKDILANICEVIYRYDCDALLLTGRPSSWPAIEEMVTSLLPIPPDRIFAMGKYRVGSWYPFADALGEVTDPKTTVVVGAILCALAEGQLEGFSFDPTRLTLTSTARYIGEMELNGQIKKPKVWFDVDVTTKEEKIYTRTISFGGPIAVGFRQLDVERWTTTRFYFLEFVSEDVRHKYAQGLPFSVTLELRVAGLDDEEKKTDTDRDEGEFTITEVLDSTGNPVNNALEIRLQTLSRDEGFWLDTGIVYA
ncbi:MAG: virulence factor SrfB, partial [Desulfovibrio sp.]|nr:virulence factor SrfB [Desulfovibrio sp.]